jgi:hypothetical protein
MHDSRIAVSPTYRRKPSDELKDEVYRQMFRLEAQRLGAERNLAVALLRAWMASDVERQSAKERAWLRKICPICLAMIEGAGQPHQMRETI